jgi:hypothetical protein
MPIDPVPYPRPVSSEPACRAVVAARVHAPRSAELLLRYLRVRVMQCGLLDDPELIAGAARDAGLDPTRLAAWALTPEVDAQLRSDFERARDPLPAARALDHKLGGPAQERRYTAPSYIVGDIVVPGFTPVEAYEIAIANSAPDLQRRPKPASVQELLRWTSEPLATAEVALVMQTGIEKARAALHEVARFAPAGADGYWTLG